ncbi:MAG: hypothetical protein ACKVOT_13875 [Polaromonas sp.]
MTRSGNTLELPDALSWADEYSWSPVEQSKTYTTTGALLIEEHVKQSGRPITLEGSEDRTWCSRALVEQLRAWAAQPSAVMTLVIRGITHQVTFDHEKGALLGLPVMFYADGSIEASDPYVPTIRLIEI